MNGTHIDGFTMMIVFLIQFWIFFFAIKRAGYGSESEGDDEAATISLASDLGRINKASTKSAVKLQEIGPRMTLQLIKIEDGLCAGTIIFSEQGNFLPPLPHYNILFPDLLD